MKRTLLSMYLILNVKTLLLTIAAIVLTYLCIKFEFTADLPFALIGIAVVFPIVFSIGGAYTRREAALKDYANIKAHSRAIFFASRDWIDPANVEAQENCKLCLKELLISIKDFLSTKHNDLALREQREQIVYDKFSDLSAFIKSLRKSGLPSGEASRANQYLSKMMDAFESQKHVYQYRTPVTLRAYSKFFTFVTPVIYSPYFGHIGKDMNIVLAMISPLLFSIILAGLDNIQDHLENPFDQVGEDDVKINPEKIIANL